VKKSKFFFFLILLSLSFSALSQDDAEEEARRKVLEQYSNRQADEKLEDSIQETAEGLQELSPVDVEEAMEESQKPIVGDGKIKDSYLSTMMNGMMKQMIGKFLKENPFSKMPREEVKSMIVLNTQGLPVNKVFEKNPKLLEMLIDWIRDPIALPKFMGIVNKPEKVKIYGIIVIALFIISFALNLFNSKGSLFKRILKKLGIFLGAFTLNLVAFYILFQPNIQPTLTIVFKYYHL